MPRIPITITDYTKDISKATESFLAGTPRPMSRIPIIRPSYSRTTNTHTTKHTSPKRWKNKHSSPYRWKRAGYNICRQDTTSATPYDTYTNEANDMHTTTECNGSRPCRGQCIRPGAFPNLAPVHTAEGIPQPSTIEVICVPGTPRPRQGYRIISCGCTKTNVKDPKYRKHRLHQGHFQGYGFISCGYTKASAKDPFNHLGLNQGQFQGYHIIACGYTKTTVKDPYHPTIVQQKHTLPQRSTPHRKGGKPPHS